MFKHISNLKVRTSYFVREKIGGQGDQTDEGGGGGLGESSESKWDNEQSVYKMFINAFCVSMKTTGQQRLQWPCVCQTDSDL